MRRNFTLLSIALLAVGGVAALGTLSSATSERADCPGKIVCPLTGELVCRDQCPAVDKNRSDCPGQIICPATSEPVCVDRCPAESTGSAKPSCCEKGKQ